MSARPPHRVELHSGPDDRGRYHYSLHWMANYPPNTRLERDFDGAWHERGQHYFGRPPADVPMVDCRRGEPRRR